MGYNYWIMDGSGFLYDNEYPGYLIFWMVPSISKIRISHRKDIFCYLWLYRSTFIRHGSCSLLFRD